MTKYLLIVNYDGGAIAEPMDEWAPEDVKAHMDYYGKLIDELVASGEMVLNEAEERAVEIAALISRVPGPGGVPQQQPIEVRRVMQASDFAAMTPER